MKHVTCKRCGQPTTKNKKNAVHPSLDECVAALAKEISRLSKQVGHSLRGVNASATAALYVANLSR